MLEKEILSVNEFLASLRVAEPQRHKHLTILPLVSDKTKDLRLKTLEEALAINMIDITELGSGGAVPKLRFLNKGDEAALILQGSIIKGNLQDRAVRHTFVVYPHAEVVGDVFCIEAARWQFVRGQKVCKPAHHLSADIRMDFFRNSQGSVWDKIEQKKQRMQVNSNTASADHIYDAYQKELEEYKEAFAIKPEYVGIIGMIEGKPIGLDVSGIKGIFQRQFPDLISSFAIDALDQEYRKGVREHKGLTVKQFFMAVAKANKIEREAIGGKRLELEGENIVGSALINRDAVVHMEAFATEGSKQ